MRPLRALLIATYEMGRQPFGLASPAAWLRRAGADVHCQDLAVQAIAPDQVRAADLIGLHLPMHTATRLGAALIPELRRLNPAAHLCAFGLYAPLNEAYLRELGVQTVLGGEFEAGLAALARRLADSSGPAHDLPLVSVERLRFLVPERAGLPALDGYAHLHEPTGARRLVGYTEASRGCKHHCRHCPVVPVYQGRFRIVPVEVVMADVAQQVDAGATHITFGDPDFLNGPGHATRLVRAFRERFPGVTYDITAKVEHLLARRDLLPLLRATGCAFITSAFEALDDRILNILNKGHTVADLSELVGRCRQAHLPLNPTFVAFTPWTSHVGYRRFLAGIVALGLVDNVAPIQYAIRLLLPAESGLLAHPDVQAIMGPFDRVGLAYPWRHPDSAIDALQERLLALVKTDTARGAGRRETFARLWRAAHGDDAASGIAPPAEAAPMDPIPFLSEPWYC